MMRSRLLFRENGHVIRTRRRSLLSWLQDVVGFVGLAAVVVLLYGWGLAVDQRAGDSDALMEARAFAQGRALADADHATQVRDAYEQGLNDAMRSVRDRPEGVALAQACLALADGGTATRRSRVAGSRP